MTAPDTPELQAMLDAATDGPWGFIESQSPDGQEYMGCGVTTVGDAEFVWFEGEPELDIPTARLIAAAPDLAAEVIALRAEKARLASLLAEADKCVVWEAQLPLPRDFQERVEAALGAAND